ncbi:hypothetical protein AAC387_Pa08g1405 [Persea americana]
MIHHNLPCHLSPFGPATTASGHFIFASERLGLPFQTATCTAQRPGCKPSAAMDCCLIPSAEQFPTVKIPPSHRPPCCPAHSQRPITRISINWLCFFPT